MKTKNQITEKELRAQVGECVATNNGRHVIRGFCCCRCGAQPNATIVRTPKTKPEA